MNFRLTKKAQDRLRLRPSELAPPPEEVGGADWHCNVVTLGRRPCFLFAHSLSLYAFFAPVAGISGRDAFRDAFRAHLLNVLASEGLPAGAEAKLIDDGSEVLCRATDRRVIGTMVDHANMSWFVVSDAGRLDDRVFAKIHEFINKSPMSVLGGENPRRVLRRLLLPSGTA
jgi:hypothetical protein